MRSAAAIRWAGAIGLARRAATLLAAAAVAPVLIGAALAGCQSAASAIVGIGGRPVPAVPPIVPRAAPAGWHLAALPDGTAVLAYPPVMRAIAGDQGEVSAARLSPSGAYLLYLNSTPRQGAETLSDWPLFRVQHQRAEDAKAVRMLAASHGVRFVGGTGTCVIDSYVTRVHSNHYTEMACLVRGRTGESVIVAAAPTSGWSRASGLLLRAIAAYRVR
jgi:hypothetical protein